MTKAENDFGWDKKLFMLLSPQQTILLTKMAILKSTHTKNVYYVRENPDLLLIAIVIKRMTSALQTIVKIQNVKKPVLVVDGY